MEGASQSETERLNAVISCPEAETQQVPTESSQRSRTNGVQSLHASISEVSSPSIVEPSDKHPQWMPFALRWYFIAIIATLSIAFAATASALYWRSHKNNGLCSEDSAMLGWKFVPTLIAVLYTQLTAMLLGAVKRTDAFAKMARANGRIPLARYTLLERSKPWWTTFARGFQRRRNGGSWNWCLILSCGTYILAILGISPISAAILGTKEVLQTTPEVFVQLEIPNGMTLRPLAERETYLQTMAAISQNYSTSPWITDGFVVLPFWPEDSTDTSSPWDSQVSNSGTWEAETTIFHNELVCTKLSLEKKDIYLRHAQSEYEAEINDKLYLASVLLESNFGCKFNFTVNVTENIPEGTQPAVHTPFLTFSSDWVSWSDINHIILGGSYSDDATGRLNEDCHESEIIMMSTPWWPAQFLTPTYSLLENMSMSAYACHPDYSMAIVPARATVAQKALSVEFDEDIFHQKRIPLPSTIFDLRELNKIYTDIQWSSFVPQPSMVETSAGGDFTFGGAAAMLGAPYNFSVPRMMADSDLPMVAAQFRRRFFAEIIGTSLQHTDLLEERRTTGRRLGFVRKVIVSGQATSIACGLLLASSTFLFGVLWMMNASKRTLNAQQDPSTPLGTSVWAGGNATVLRKFTKLDLATRKMLKNELANRIFFSKHGNLDEVEADVQIAHKRELGVPSYSAAPILPGLRLRNLTLFILYILSLLAGIVVLRGYAQRSGLHQAFFTYRANIKFFGNENTISPFAIIPATFAIIVALLWESVDTTCRTVQPYISLRHHAKRPSQGIGLSYVSSFWLFASFKALQNRHWLLSLITTTTFLLQVLTIAMSALFDSSNGVLINVSKVSQKLELRSVPLVQQLSIETKQSTWQFDYNVTNDESAQEFGHMVQRSLYTSGTDWMYTALIQTAFKGPEPVWSQDDWSFVPVSSVLKDTVSSKHRNSTPGSIRSLESLTVQTPALRARLDCSNVEWPRNSSLWLAAQNETSNKYLNITGLDNYFSLEDVVQAGNLSTRLTAQADVQQCCANLTRNIQYNPAITAYWTENWWKSDPENGAFANGGTGRNFTVKWIRGPASFARTMPFLIDILYFPEPPAIQALNCMPTFESSQAEVTVDPKSGIVQQYRILDTPVREHVAWSDNFQWRNLSEDARYTHSRVENYGNSSDTWYYYNVDVTLSYGYFFMKSLLNAAYMKNALLDWMFPHGAPGPYNRDLLDKVFNMRDNTTGLNLDFMSYAAFAQVGFDPTALLDPETLAKTSQKVFSTFFQHFVSNNMSRELGGFVYQPIGINLSVNPPMKNMPTQYMPDGSVAPKFEDVVRHTNETTTATLSTPVEVLRMNPVAFWLAASILVWLIITTIILASVQRKYYGGMMRNVECIADMLVLIAGSERLLAVVREKGFDNILREDNILTRLGWFRDEDGTMRWRIELVEDKQVRMRPIRLGPEYAPVPDGSDEEDPDSLPGPGASVSN